MLKRIEISAREFPWDRVNWTRGTVPILEDRCVWGVAIAPESEVRAVILEPQLKSGRSQPIPLVEGHPITWPEPRADIRVHPLDYTTGRLVLVVATEARDVQHLPIQVASRARVALYGDLRGRVFRLHRPRGVVHALCRYVIAASCPNAAEFETVLAATVSEIHLNGDAEIGTGSIELTRSTYTSDGAGSPEELGTWNGFGGDVLEVTVNNYAYASAPAHTASLVVSLSGYTDDPASEE